MASPAKHRKKKRAMAGEVPLDSFSDIAFLLIIFFMVATVLTTTQGFITDLPAGQENKQAAEEKVPSIMLTGSQILYNSKPVSFDELRATLIQLKLAEKTEPSKRIVQLESSPTTTWEYYFPVWAAIVKHGGVVAIVKPEE
jgi:biopolymer transport protein ExbD